VKVFYSHYALEPKDFKAKHLSCEGVLLSFQNDSNVSYSLYHPIKTLKDISVKEFIKNFDSLVLSEGAPLKRVYDLALREEEQNSLNVSCYRLCKNFQEADEAVEKVVKVKIHSLTQVLEEINLNSKKEFILDANGQLNEEDVKLLENELSGLHRRPCEFKLINYKIWCGFRLYQLHRL